jgi:tRNA(Ile)-lysidine synthase
MAPVAGRWRRPLLGLDRATTRAATVGLRVWDDPHNADPAFARSRVRHDALPALETALGPGVAAALARTAALLRADADALDAWADTTYAAAGPPGGLEPGLEVGLEVAVLAQVPAAVRTRVLRRAACDAGCPAADLSAHHVGELDRLVTDWRGQGPLHLPGRVAAERRCGRLHLTRRP